MKRAAFLLFLAACAPAPAARIDPEARPAPEPAPQNPAAVKRLVSELFSNDIEARERAEADLLALGAPAESELRDILRSNPAAEVRARVEAVLALIEIRPTLPQSGRLGDVAIDAMHAFAWQNEPRGETSYVSTVWSIRNTGSTATRIRIARARVVHGGRSSDVAITGTKEEPDPVYELEAGLVKKPALKMPSSPRLAAGTEVYAVLDFTDGAGRVLRLRSESTWVEPLPGEKPPPSDKR